MALPIRRFQAPALVVRLILVVLGAANACASAPPTAGATPGAPPGADRACTQIGCVEGLTIDVASTSGWAPGTYRFDFELDQEKVSCEGTLPLRACEHGPSVRCTPEGAAERVMISESGCALPAAEHSLPSISIRGEPARVRLTVSRDGTQLAAEEMTPQYRTMRPNGPECEPVCRQASAKVTLR